MFDIVINNGTLIDPERFSAQTGSIGIEGCKIAAISAGALEGKERIDASGRMVCPGFIDVHGHIDGSHYPAELSLRQGVTTTIGGNCGLSPAFMDEFFDCQERQGFEINQAELVGHSFTLRRKAGIHDDYAAATSAERLHMSNLAEKALDEGACGISFGLDYAPGSSLTEILLLAQLAAQYGRIVSIHTRVLTPDGLESLVEVDRIARETGAKVLVSHFVYQYGCCRKIMRKALEMVEKSRADGLDIRIDSGMYMPWATSVGTATFCEQNIREFGWKCSDLLISSGKYTGQFLTPEIYHELRKDHPDECLVCFDGDEETVYDALIRDYAMPSSDTAAYEPGQGHPQIAGTFPRYLRMMVQERGLIPLIEAVRKATLLPAETIGLQQKGRLHEGYDADITVFDAASIEDRARFAHHGKPDAFPVGIEHVIVNGQHAFSKGKILTHSAGKMIRF